MSKISRVRAAKHRCPVPKRFPAARRAPLSPPVGLREAVVSPPAARGPAHVDERSGAWNAFKRQVLRAGLKPVRAQRHLDDWSAAKRLPLRTGSKPARMDSRLGAWGMPKRPVLRAGSMPVRRDGQLGTTRRAQAADFAYRFQTCTHAQAFRRLGALLMFTKYCP